MAPEVAGQLAELAEYAIVAGAGVYAWLIGRGTVSAPGGRQPSDRWRWWLRTVGLVGFGCGVLLVAISAARLASLIT